MKIEIINQTSFQISKKKIQTWVRLFEKKLLNTRSKFRRQHLKKTLTLAFMTPRQIQRLNKLYRQKNRPTDVLSFTSILPTHLGDLALCPQVIKKQAKAHNINFNHELSYMILHGILHLLGYEHESSSIKAKIMFNLQDRIFESLSSQL